MQRMAVSDARIGISCLSRLAFGWQDRHMSKQAPILLNTPFSLCLCVFLAERQDQLFDAGSTCTFTLGRYTLDIKVKFSVGTCQSPVVLLNARKGVSDEVMNWGSSKQLDKFTTNTGAAACEIAAVDGQLVEPSGVGRASPG
jgi:hypothetical protein